MDVSDANATTTTSDMSALAPAKLFDLRGRVALVSGAAGGIGQELAAGMGLAGADIVLTDLPDSGLENVSSRLEANGIGCHTTADDLSDRSAPQRIVDSALGAFGRLDILINCAVINQRVALLDVDGGTYDRLMDIDLRAPFFLAQAAARVMVDNGGGAIVNLSSVNAQIGIETNGVYGPAKGALSQLTKVMAVEWSHLGIRANAIAPGFIETPLTRALRDDQLRHEWILDRTPLGRLGQPEELVGMCLLLVSDAGAYITGQTLFVDGGMLAGSRWDV